MPQQGTYPLNGRVPGSNAADNVTGVVAGATADIPLTQLYNSTNPLTVAQGGTGASTAPGARAALGTAASGANSDITSLSGLTTPLSVGQGGVGAVTLPAHAVVLGNGTSAVHTAAPGTANFALLSGGASVDPVFAQLTTPMVNFTQAGTGAVTETVDAKLQRFVDVKDFGAVGNGIADDTAAVQAAFNSFGASGGICFFPPGSYKVTSTLTCTNPVLLLGYGSGEISGTSTTPASKIVWAGGASDVLHYGGFGSTFVGGGIQYLAIDGASLATACLVTKDCQRSNFKQLMLSNATISAWFMTNTLGQVSGFYMVEDLRIFLRGGSTQNAIGINVAGVTTPGADGVTLCVMNRVRIDHANGAGVQIGTNNGSNKDAGDNFVWTALFTFRANAETGPGVWFTQINASSICQAHTFYSPVVNGGFIFATSGLNTGTRIISANESDLASNVTVMANGAGVSDVDFDTQQGAAFGRGVIPNAHWTQLQDAMFFMAYNGTTLLNTANGLWNVNNNTGGTIADGGAVGGSCNITTGPTSGNAMAVYQPNTSAGGVAYTLTPYGSFIFNLLQTSACQLRVGFFDGVGASITNGVYAEFDASLSANWRLVCVSGGTSTVITTGVGVNAASLWEWMIRFDGSFATFLYRASGNIGITNAGTITTNIPTALLSWGISIRTQAAASKSVVFNSSKLGFVDESYPLK